MKTNETSGAPEGANKGDQDWQDAHKQGRADFASGQDRQAAIARVAPWLISSWAAGWEEATADASAQAQGRIAMPSEYPTAEAARSYDHISHSGTALARSDRDEFVNKVQSVYDAANALAETDAQRSALKEAINTYKKEYLCQTHALMNVRANSYSGHVAGRAKLNVKQVNSRSSALDKAVDRFVAWDKAAAPRVRDAVLAARTPDQISKLQAAEAAQKAAQQGERLRKDIDLMRRILAFKAADPLKIGPFLVTKVNKDKEGYPLTLTIKAVDGAPLSDDKLNLAAVVFGKRGAEGMRAGKEKIRQLVDAVRTAQEESPQENERTGRERGM